MSQLASWAMEAGPEVAHSPQVGVRESPGPAGKCLPHRPPPLLSLANRKGDHRLYCPNCDIFESEEGILLKSSWATGANRVADCKSWV